MRRFARSLKFCCRGGGEWGESEQDNDNHARPKRFELGCAVMDLLSSPFAPAFAQFADEIGDECFICSPYITCPPMRALVDALDAKSPRKDVKIHVLTDISYRTVALGGTDTAALLHLFERRGNVHLTYLPGIHAKVYIANPSSAIVASANFTQGGARANFEYGVRVKTRAAVQKIRKDIDAYRKLGADITWHKLRAINARVDEIKALIKIEQRHIARVTKLAERQHALENDLIKARVKKQSINAIFSDTLLYLLSRHPATTKELHPLVRDIHPDLCDDSTDRVIDGVTYGKLWKHQVRTAQLHLKSAGRIINDERTKQWRKTT